MVITYFGHEFFKIQFGNLTLATNPISKDSSLKATRFGADIALISLNSEDTNGIEQVTFGERAPFVISGPGEYEVKDVFIKGFLSPAGGNKKFNTIYTVSLESMNICFLGALGSKDVAAETKSALGDIDILFVPIGGDDVLTSVEAAKFAVSLEPRLIIPMHYVLGVQADTSLKTFLKEIGAEKVEPVDKLTLKKKDLEGKEGDVVVLANTA